MHHGGVLTRKRLGLLARWHHTLIRQGCVETSLSFMFEVPAIRTKRSAMRCEGTELSDQEILWRLTETFSQPPVQAVKWVPLVFRIWGASATED